MKDFRVGGAHENSRPIDSTTVALKVISILLVELHRINTILVSNQTLEKVPKRVAKESNVAEPHRMIWPSCLWRNTLFIGHSPTTRQQGHRHQSLEVSSLPCSGQASYKYVGMRHQGVDWRQRIGCVINFKQQSIRTQCCQNEKKEEEGSCRRKRPNQPAAKRFHFPPGCTTSLPLPLPGIFSASAFYFRIR